MNEGGDQMFEVSKMILLIHTFVIFHTKCIIILQVVFLLLTSSLFFMHSITMSKICCDWLLL